MRVLLVSATRQELFPLLAHFKIEEHSLDNICSFKSKDNWIDVLFTGVGMVNTAYALGKNLTSEYHFAIQAGIAGAINYKLETGSLVNITEEELFDFGAEDGEAFLSVELLGLPAISSVANDGLDFPNKIKDIPVAKGITVNKVHGNEQSIKRMKDLVHADVESMEGFPFLWACQQNKISCAEIRAISNRVERRNKENWNIPLAIENLNKFLIDFIENLE